MGGGSSFLISRSVFRTIESEEWYVVILWITEVKLVLSLYCSAGVPNGGLQQSCAGIAAPSAANWKPVSGI